MSLRSIGCRDQREPMRKTRKVRCSHQTANIILGQFINGRGGACMQGGGVHMTVFKALSGM